MARVLRQVQQQGPVLRVPQELEPLAQRQEQPLPVPLQQGQPPQERQPVLPPAQVLQQLLGRQRVQWLAQSVWGSARQ
ncbi:hypothetical protein [Serratia marcescens]|uniref:hypothetical protein n=1 Tax=Serratia marcescens TaxID=615 RepID=UPI0007607318|nr:hypothetical protein [Serratia marcescens]